MTIETDFVRAPEEKLEENHQKFQVELPQWTGPYDVLLQVIDEQEMNLLDLDISALLDHYLIYIEKLEDVNLDEAGEFLVVAATLAQIKSKLLLPKEEQASEEEEKDPRDELVRYLMEYQKIKAAAELLRERPLLGRDVFVKGVKELFHGVEAEGHGNLFQLVRGFQKVMKDLKAEIPMEFEREEVAVSDRFHEIFSQLKENGRATFLELLQERRTKLYVICSFLAILELVRLKKISIAQVAEDLPIVLEYRAGAEDDLSHSQFDGNLMRQEEYEVEEDLKVKSNRN